MVAPLIVAGAMAGLQFMEAKHNAAAQKRAAKFQAMQMRFNSVLIGMEKREVLEQSEDAVRARESVVKQMIGAQKAGFAGQGVDVSSEVALAFKQQEHEFGANDVATIRNNAWREAMGLEIQQRDLETQANFTELHGSSQARQTEAAGGMQAAGTLAGGFQRYSASKG